ncbi:MAG: NAD-dependent epimerase/dehydratase family protein, partial [Myxococcota bacterium]
VHVGTEAAVFTGQHLARITEAVPYPKKHRYLYAETKARAEQAVLAANQEGFVTLSLRPSMIWGPRDRSVLPTVLQMVEAGRFVWINGGAYARSVTHVYNLTQALMQALEHGEGGNAYFIADDEETTLYEFFTALVRTQGVELPRRSVPAWFARPLAGVLEDTWRTFGFRSTPPLHRFVAELMSSHVTVDTSKAKAELGYAPVVRLEEGLAGMRA